MLNLSRFRRIRAGIAIALALIGAAVLILSVHAPDDAVAVLAPTGPEAVSCGVLSIPGAGVHAQLYLLQDGCSCACSLGLYGGGIILGGDAEAWAGLALGDAAILHAEGTRMALELAEITDCIRLGDRMISLQGIVRPTGDVLLCVQRAPPWVVRLYRWIIL